MSKREPQIILKTDERKVVFGTRPRRQIHSQINGLGREPGFPRGR